MTSRMPTGRMLAAGLIAAAAVALFTPADDRPKPGDLARPTPAPEREDARTTVTDDPAPAETSALVQPGFVAPVETGNRFDQDFDRAYRAAKQQGRPLLVYLTSATCEPCKRFELRVKDSSTVRAWIAGRAVWVTLDINKPLSPESRTLAGDAKAFGAIAPYMPAIVVYFPDGRRQRIDATGGAFDSSTAFLKSLEQIL